jgi:hypothetical protein
MLTIERATLLKIARDTASQRMAARPSLLSVYLTGSVAAGDPLLGEATDIDLVCIDAEPPPVAREVVRLTDQVALDIQSRHKSEYANAKTLRVHPWRGPEICEPFFLLDPKHFFELAQANVRGQFHRPDFVAARARTFAAWARAELRLGLLPGEVSLEPVTLEAFGRGLLNAANAVMTLTGFPAAGRRLLLKLETAAQKLKRPDLYQDFVALLSDSALKQSQAKVLLHDWSAAYSAGQSTNDELIHPARRTIYERGFNAQIEADRAVEMLWLMLSTWQALLRNLPGDSPHADRYAAYLQVMGLDTAAGFAARVEQTRAYVTLAADTVETWAEQNGA